MRNIATPPQRSEKKYLTRKIYSTTRDRDKNLHEFIKNYFCLFLRNKFEAALALSATRDFWNEFLSLINSLTNDE